MSDFDLKLDGIADGMLLEKTDAKNVAADQKKRLYANTFTYIRN